MGGAYGLDYPAVIQMAGLGAPPSRAVSILLFEALPSVEAAMVAALKKDDDE